MYIFYADHRCDKCLKCQADEIMPDFITLYDGHGFVSNHHLGDREIQVRMERAILVCPHGALHLARLKKGGK